MECVRKQGYAADMSEKINDVDEWMKTIRDPAERTKEPIRRIDYGSAVAEYQTAPLQDGRWAVRMTCNSEFVTGMSIPWRAFKTREEAVDFFRAEAAAFFAREKNLKKGRAVARRKIMELLEPNSLFGYQEPEPEQAED